MAHEWQELKMNGYWGCHKCNTSIQVQGTPSPDLKRSVMVADDHGIYTKSDPMSCDEIIVHRVTAS